jgi:hypothetical protein
MKRHFGHSEIKLYVTDTATYGHTSQDGQYHIHDKVQSFIIFFLRKRLFIPRNSGKSTNLLMSATRICTKKRILAQSHILIGTEDLVQSLYTGRKYKFDGHTTGDLLVWRIPVSKSLLSDKFIMFAAV